MNKAFSSVMRVVVLSLLFVTTARLNGASPLVDAAHRGDAARVRSLLAERPDLKTRDADGNTALH